MSLSIQGVSLDRAGGDVDRNVLTNGVVVILSEVAGQMAKYAWQARTKRPGDKPRGEP